MVKFLYLTIILVCHSSILVAQTTSEDMWIETNLQMCIVNPFYPDYNPTDSVAQIRIVKSKMFWGVVYPRELRVVKLDSSRRCQRYTLTNEEVSKAELIIKDKIDVFNQILEQRKDHYKRPPVSLTLSYNDLKCFFRQYQGHIDKKRNVYVQIYFSKEPLREEYLNGFKTAITEGASYSEFGVTVNITDSTLMNTPIDFGPL